MQWVQDTFASLTGEYSASAASPSRGRPGGALQAEGTLSRDQLLRFFAAGEDILIDEATRRRLKDAKLLKQDVEDIITDLQKAEFERQGVQGDFGIAFLGKVSDVYKGDNEVMAALLKFAALEEDAMDEAELPEADYEQKQRLMGLAKAHAAQLMAKMQDLPPEQRQAFLQDQMLKAEQLKRSVAAGEVPSATPPDGNSMSNSDQLNFFQQLQRRQQ